MFDVPPLENSPAASPIVVTASRFASTPTSSPASVSLIDAETIERLGAPFVSDYLRLLPSTAVATSGPAGSLTEVRIRGAEASHTLLFIDGIRANDPAAGNTPRFELLNADLADRIELVRGPQSALWGSEAIGGVVSVAGDARQGAALAGLAEIGSFATRREALSAHFANDRLSASIAVAGQKSRGTDAFDGTGDPDGYSNASIRGRVTWRAVPLVELGISGFATAGRSDYDGYSPITFLHADTLDNSHNRLAAMRGWVEAGQANGLGAKASVAFLKSTNRNDVDQTEINRTRGTRRSSSGEVHDAFAIGSSKHRLVLAVEEEEERFHARDAAYAGATDQDRSRRHHSVTAEFRSDWRAISADFAVRRDAFNRFKDATTARASVLAALGGGFSATASYGEGIAQPSFYDLYGFFPGSFVGNPALEPESSRGFEAALRFNSRQFSASATAYRQRLRHEIVDVFDATTFQSSTMNATGSSKRSGIELEAGWTPSQMFRVRAQVAYLDATEPGLSGNEQVKEARRPKWSGAVTLDGTRARWTYGATLSFTGPRRDTDFDVYPAAPVRLKPYWLAGGRLGWRVTRRAELFARVANAFDADYRDAVGYRPSGRSIDGGVRLAFGR